MQRRLRATRTFFFVCYARSDAPQVEQVLKTAREEGHVLWIDHLDLTGGGVWSADIVAAIRASRAVLVFCSAQSFASRDVYREIAAASRFNKPILPIFLDDARAPDEFIYYLSVHQAIRVGDPDWRERLLCALEAMERGRRRWQLRRRSKCLPPLTTSPSQ